MPALTRPVWSPRRPDSSHALILARPRRHDLRR
jgi:hypothetical protein